MAQLRWFGARQWTPRWLRSDAKLTERINEQGGTVCSILNRRTVERQVEEDATVIEKLERGLVIRRRTDQGPKEQ